MRNRELIRKDALYIIRFSIISRILIFFKEILMASKVGANYEMDSYLLALSTIMLFTNIVADSVVVSLIPLVHEIDRRYDKDRRLDYTNNLINTIISISLLLIISGLVFAPWIIKIFGPGFKGLEYNETVKLFRIGLPIIMVTWVRAIGSGVLQADHAFKAGAKGGVSSQVAYILYLLFFVDLFGLEGLMVTGTIAVFTQIYFTLKAMKAKGFAYRWKIDLKDRYLTKLLWYLIPIAAGVGVNELNNSVDNAIASTLSVGSIAELNYANEIISLFLGIFIAAIVTVIFPVLSESHYEVDNKDLKEGVNHGIYTVLIISIPVSIVLMMMAEPIVKIVFERGAFDATASFFTAESLGYYAIGLPAMALIPLITRAYYSIKDMKTPLMISIIVLVVNILADLALAPYMGVRGVALGTSSSVILGATIGLLDLNRRLNLGNLRDIGDTLIKLSVSIIIMVAGIILTYGTAASAMRNLFLHNVITVLVSALVGIGLYSLVIKVLD